MNRQKISNAIQAWDSYRNFVGRNFIELDRSTSTNLSHIPKTSNPIFIEALLLLLRQSELLDLAHWGTIYSLSKIHSISSVVPMPFYSDRIQPRWLLLPEIYDELPPPKWKRVCMALLHNTSTLSAMQSPLENELQANLPALPSSL